MNLKHLGALVGVALGSVMLSAAANASVTPQLQNVGGYTPTTSTLSIPAHQVQGGHGVWSNARQSSVTITITGGAGVTPANCHLDSDERYFCYVYDGEGKVSGTFRTIPRSWAPNQLKAGQHIKAAVTGTFTATLEWQFYGQSYPRLHPGSLTMSLADAYKEFFGAGTRFGGKGLVSSTWTYRLPCGQTWVIHNSDGGQLISSGQITGC